ncbi:MAG: flagellar filament capping protein FliD [Planctomycetaceae bacterium]
MGTVKTSTGLASGIDTSALIQAILTYNQAAVSNLQTRLKGVQATQTGLTQVQAGLLPITSAAQQLSTKSTFQALQVQNSDPSQLSVTTNGNAVAGTQVFQAVRLATTDQSLSRGFSDATDPLGLTGQLVIGTGGSLQRPTSLDLLNDGTGVRRGTIRITDRSGATTTVDLSNVLTVSDVVNAVNNQSDVAVKASTSGGKLVLQDTSGQTTGNLTVSDLNGGHAAADLGIAQSVSSATLTGSDVYQVTSDFLLSSINDGNGLRLRSGSNDLSFSLADGSTFQVSLSGAKTVGDVVTKINDATGNNAKLTASLVNGRLQLNDATTGSGTLSVSNLTGSNAAQVLGLDGAASGNVLTGKALTGGLNSPLLRNLRGGQGISTLGQVSLTDRTGATAVVDLSQAQSLDEVINAINSATTSGGVKLQLQAGLDAKGNGISVTDTSGQSAGNLVIADLGGGTTASDLKIAVNAATSSVSSGSLALRSVNEGTSLSTYAPNGGAVSQGSFSITNSAGAKTVISVTSAVQNIGDVIDRINSAGINVTAQLNAAGDGFTLVDNSGGTGTMTVQDIGGRTATDLRLTGAATTGTDGKQRIDSRQATVVNVTADDTLTTLSSKISSAGGLVTSSIVDTGAAINAYRLTLSSTQSGSAGRLIIDDGGLGLSFAKQSVGQDAVLRVGSDPSTAFLKTSKTNTFQNAVTGYNVTLLQASDQAAVVTSSPDATATANSLNSFVSYFNQLVTQIGTLTGFDSSTNTRGPLQGDPSVLQIQSRITDLVNRVTGSASSPIRSLADVGVVVAAGGQLTFDQTKLQQALADHPQEVSQLFLDSKSGFGTQLNSLLTEINDSTTGSLTAEINAEKTTADGIQGQIDRMNSSLANRQAFLEQQFANMETVLSGLQSQSSALSALASIASTAKSSSSS